MFCESQRLRAHTHIPYTHKHTHTTHTHNTHACTQAHTHPIPATITAPRYTPTERPAWLPAPPFEITHQGVHQQSVLLGCLLHHLKCLVLILQKPRHYDACRRTGVKARLKLAESCAYETDIIMHSYGVYACRRTGVKARLKLAERCAYETDTIMRN
jgi:hypothetical protein